MTRAGLFVVAVVVLLPQTAGKAQAPIPDALPYSTSYLLTGDYVAGGVDTTSGAAENGFVTGIIHMGTTPDNTVPPGADIIAAAVYWETIYIGSTPPTGAKFRGVPLAAVRVAPTQLAQDTPCWTSGSNLTMAMFRADVLPFLPVEEDATGTKNGRRLINDADLTANGFTPHTITLPQAQGNQAPESAGASLVVVYRLPSDPLRKIVLYDGIYIEPEGGMMSQKLQGFYQSSATKSAKVTHLVASGAKNHTDLLTFNGTTIGTGIEPFVESGTSADRSWFTKTLGHDQIDNLMSPLASAPTSGYGETATTTVSHTNTSPYECMAWAGVVFSTAVKDTDHDGLPDGLEDATGTMLNPASIVGGPAETLPNLNAMGASSAHKDLFVEINTTNAANATAPTPYPDHSHMPTPDVLKLVGDAYFHGPLQIYPHFDVGPTLAAGYSAAIATLAAAAGESLPDDNYIVSTGARGGETILEQGCAPGANCQFPNYPGTVGWKYGFQKYRDARVGSNGEELTDAQQAAQKTLCKTTPNDANCRRRFDRIRRDLFHYALYAHARGRPKSTFPCLDANNLGAEYQKDQNGHYTGTCADNHINPDFYVPKSISGTADLPGGNLLITLGLWGDAATPFVIAATTLHELGHNLNLWHGGVPAIVGSKTASTATYMEPNCKPNYLSSMSYLYQVHGLFNDEDTDNDGYPDEIPHLGYSGQNLGSIGETSLTDNAALASTPAFRPAWFVPATSDLSVTQGLSAATKYCNGFKFPFALNQKPAGWVDMARAMSPTMSVSIDWNGNQQGDTATNLNVNFDGTPLIEQPGQLPTGGNPIITSTLFGFNDWDVVRLDQIGAGRSTGRFKSFEGTQFEGTQFEGTQFEGSQFEGTQFEGTQFEGTQFEGTQFEGSQFEGTQFEGTQFEGSPFEGSQFEGSQFEGTQFEGSQFEGQEIDLTTANSLGRSAPNSLKGCVIGRDLGCDDADSTHFHRQRAGWKPPTFGIPALYHLYRFNGALGPAAVTGATQIGTGTADTTLVDTTELPDYNACLAAARPGVECEFTYFVKADLTDDPPGPSANSNFARVRPTNTAPTANPDAYTVESGGTLTVAARGVLINDTDADSNIANAGAVLESGPSKASAFTLSANGSFTYTPQPGATGTDTFTYRANSGLWTDGVTPMSANSDPATVTITLHDTTPPTVTVTVPAPNGLNGWFKTQPVLVTVSATDPSFVTAFSCTDSVNNGSPISVVPGSLTGINTQNASGTLSLSAEGTHSVVCTATDGAGNSGAKMPGSITTGSLKIDTVLPVASITSGPAEGAELAFGAGLGSGSSVTFGFSATDPTAPVASGVALPVECKLDGAAFGACTSPKAFSGLALGPHTFTVHARDNAGNLGADVVRNFKVVYLYALTPLKSPVTIGSAVPINFTLKDQSGTVVSTLTATVPMTKMESIFNGATVPAGGCVASATGTPEVLYSPATGAAGGSNFRYVSGGYQFNWDSTTANTTPISTGKGCYTVRITLSDGSNPKLTNAVQLK